MPTQIDIFTEAKASEALTCTTSIITLQATDTQSQQTRKRRTLQCQFPNLDLNSTHLHAAVYGLHLLSQPTIVTLHTTCAYVEALICWLQSDDADFIPQTEPHHRRLIDFLCLELERHQVEVRLIPQVPTI